MNLFSYIIKLYTCKIIRDLSANEHETKLTINKQ